MITSPPVPLDSDGTEAVGERTRPQVDQDPTDIAARTDGTSTLDLSGRCVGSSYILVRPIGQGATGTVWRGVDRSTGEQVAVKLLHESLLRQPKLVTRFVQERTILLMLRHRNVVRVRDLFSVGESLGLVMDLVEGGSMRDHLREHHTVAAGEAARLTAQVAAALAEAHDLGVIHRDLKPDNVLLRMQDGRLDTRLTDFGIARVLNTPSLTTPHAVVGTPHYMAPEAFHGAPTSAATDVYALGVLIYELVVGRPPYDSDSVADLLRQHLENEPERRPGIPDALWDVIVACMAKKPRLRPTAAELVADLGAVAHAAADVPALPRPAPSSRSLPEPARRTPLPGQRAERTEPPALRPAVEHPSLAGGTPRIPRRRNQVPSWRWARPGAVVVLVCGAMVGSGLATNAWHLSHRPEAEDHQALAPVDVAGAAVRRTSPRPSRSTATRTTSRPAPAPTRPDRPDIAAQPVERPVAATSRPRTAKPVEATPYGPWNCESRVFLPSFRDFAVVQPCQTVGPAVQIKGVLSVPRGGPVDATVALRDVDRGRTVAEYRCDNLLAGEGRGSQTCGPRTVTPAKGNRYVVVVEWTYSHEGRTASRTSTGAPFDW